jgi:hypothetical protein
LWEIYNVQLGCFFLATSDTLILVFSHEVGEGKKR